MKYIYDKFLPTILKIFIKYLPSTDLKKKKKKTSSFISQQNRFKFNITMKFYLRENSPLNGSNLYFDFNCWTMFFFLINFNPHLVWIWLL